MSTLVSHNSLPPSQQHSPIQPSNKGLLSLLKSSATTTQFKQIHAQIIKTASHQETHLLTTLISSSPSFHHANLIFRQIPNPNVFHWTAIITASSCHGRAVESLLLFKSMQESNTKPNNFTFSSVLSACASSNAISEGRQVHSLYIRHGLHRDIYVDTALIHLYGKCMQLDCSRQIFERLPSQNLASLNAMIFSCANCGDMTTGESLFSSMREKDCVSYASMMLGYGNEGDVGTARDLFDNMTERSIGSWNSMISVYSQHGLVIEALSLFCELLNSGLFPNDLTLSSVLSLCGRHGSSSTGRGVHSCVVKLGLEVDGFLSCALIDMYAKCGYIDLAHQVFSTTCHRNLGTWNSIIFAFGSHGKGESALAKLSQMEMEGIKPNELTFLGILTACSHAGLVREGCSCFSDMVEKHKLAPGREHYACLVDLLGRAGDLMGVLDVIGSMPVAPDVSTWGSLLNACRIHSNVQLGHYASDRILELDPSHSGGHVLLSNICSSAGHWDAVSRIRVGMKEKGIKKRIPGSSWIQVNEVLHRFYAMDTLHPQAQEVYGMLGCLMRELRVMWDIC